MNEVALDILMHYGVGHENGGHSGRYPWGSGDSPYQHAGDFLSRIEQLQKEGKTEKEIAKELDLTTTQLRAQKSLAKATRRGAEVATAKKLYEEGHTPTEIARMMGYNSESSIRNLLNQDSEARMNAARATADRIKAQIDKQGMVDVGEGVELGLGISREKLDQALYILKSEGYNVYKGRVEQATNPGKFTTMIVATDPDKKYKDIYETDKIGSMEDYISYDNGESFKPAFHYPESFDSKRLQIKYAEDGGIDKDGLIELRRGVDDISLGDANYSQVRILVDGTHYMKGMAAYADDLPDGIDIRFNTNKTKDVPVFGDKNSSVLKPIKKDDPNNPFGSLIKEHGGQSTYIDEDGNEKWRVINKRSDEGDWDDWDKKLPAQFLAKQPLKLIEQQLKLTVADKKAEFDEIMALDNPTVKKKMLDTFAEDCDSAAVHLKAAALPRQKYQVLLPLKDIKDNEVYAPNFENGETVALVRFPHAGTFEIPILKVNNKNKEGESRITPQAKDAVGINRSVAERLSGADFDGDTVLVIPCNSPNSKVKIKSTPALFSDFDPHLEYKGLVVDGKDQFKRMTKKNTQTEMGKISNLITDMTLKGASNEELAKAVKHSMVVIDAEKHGLDYKRSEADNDIAALKRRYQGHYTKDGRYSEGAATLISRASAEESVLKRRGSPQINEDGSLSWKTAYDKDLYYTDKKGKTKTRMQKSTQMAEVSDAFDLSSGKPQEEAYARYANAMKSLANTARKERMVTGSIKKNKEAAEQYKNEVESLNNKLLLAQQNKPRERQAQFKTNSEIKMIKQSNPDISNEDLKKFKQQALTRNRAKYGAQRHPVVFTDREWDAVQNGAVSENTLWSLLKYADSDTMKERATPRSYKTNITSAKKARIKAMSASGFTNQEIAKVIGISASAVSEVVRPKEKKEGGA